ncbi:hypothetical protein [Nostoc sphaeroides]|uniref:Uncharacterized protein n=1 Tax=Nostoc sphaeroides CCNUC1 TaxID=2653204 RepID=A0A5P8WIS3_9NOSO|nr:hypothetical protein [Nostoc sphaeroides]QFS52757.1 hypothetical protein GXM_10021 [Nostoc sphaeroides CCNUC1]
MTTQIVENLELFSEAQLEALEFLPEELENIESELYPNLDSISLEVVAKDLEAYFEGDVEGAGLEARGRSSSRGGARGRTGGGIRDRIRGGARGRTGGGIRGRIRDRRDRIGGGAPSGGSGAGVPRGKGSNTATIQGTVPITVGNSTVEFEYAEVKNGTSRSIRMWRKRRQDGVDKIYSINPPVHNNPKYNKKQSNFYSAAARCIGEAFYRENVNNETYPAEVRGSWEGTNYTFTYPPDR